MTDKTRPWPPAADPATDPAAPEVTVMVVSYNTRDLTLAALRTLFATTRRTRMHVAVLDNASADGSADAIRKAFPEAEVIASDENLGFAGGNNFLAERARTEYLLLLNPDTECHATAAGGAVDALMDFARANPQAGIWGGRTVFPDGRLNPGSCWRRITAWSLFCSATGLTAIFPRSAMFNPESYGGWQRDSVREVDVVQGCFFLIRKELWCALGGFDRRYFMYGEEADMCLRARAQGFRPAITPDAEIMHLAGAASTRSSKTMLLARAKTTLVRDHWAGWKVPFGIGLMWLWSASRMTAARILAVHRSETAQARRALWDAVWRDRHNWLAGYGQRTRVQPPASHGRTTKKS